MQILEMFLQEDSAKRVCRPDGDPRSKIAIVGEAPGAEEEKRGIPFVGQSGWLLWELLKSVGIFRSQVYVDNVILERPPKNDISKFISFSTKGLVKTTAAYETYEKELYERLKKTEANVVLAVGAVSTYALTRKTGVLNWRGSVLWSSIVGKKVIPTIHPASALRQYIYRHYILIDLIKLLKEADYPELRYNTPTLIVNPDFEKSLALLKELEEAQRVAFDIEVVGDEVYCISFSHRAGEAFSITFVEKGKNKFTLEEEAQLWALIARILENPLIEKAGQNLEFDVSYLFRKYGIRTTNLHDSMIAHAILFPDLPKGLDFITSHYTCHPYYKGDGKKYMKIGGEEKDFWEYNARDSLIVIEALPGLLRDIKKQGNEDTYKIQKGLIEPLCFMTSRGFKVDLEGLEKERKEAEEKALEAMEEFRQLTSKYTDKSINPASPKQLGEYFYEIRGEKPYRNRKTGSITTDELALKRLARKGYAEASALLTYRHLTKRISTYFDVKLDSDGRLRCSYNPVGTKTGRLSSSQTIFGTGTNLQNLPTEMKKHLKADDGYLLYEIDLSQAENRIVAFIAPEPAMMYAFTEGIDVHSFTASLIFGIPIDEIIQMNEEGIKAPIGGGHRTHRYWGKTCNHALNYGLGYRSFALRFELPEREARQIHDAYHSKYTGIKRYHEWVVAQLRLNRTLTNLLGRRRVFLDRWGDSLFKEAYAFIPQSTVADKINRGLLYLWENQELFKPVELLNQVHDSIVFQIPESIGLKAHAHILFHIKKKLEEPLIGKPETFVIPAEVKVGRSLHPMEPLDMNSNVIEQLERIAKWSGEKS